MPILEPSIYALWMGAQVNATTPVATGSLTRRFIQVAGDFAVDRDDGAEEYGDIPVSGSPASSKYGGTTDWVNSVLGSGEPGVEGTPTETAWLLWAFHGAETVAAVASVPGPPAVPANSKHTFNPQLGIGKPITAAVRVGATTSVTRRQKFNNAYISRIQVEGSTANKAVRVTPRLISLDPGERFDAAAEPTLPLPVERPFLYTDGSGTFTIDGTVFRGQSQFTLILDDAWEAVFADDTVPHDLVQGNPVVTIGVTVFADPTGIGQINKVVYGSTAPATGAKPLKTIAALGSYAFDLRHRDAAGGYTGRRFTLTIPGVKWTAPAYPGPNPSGGATELAFAGAMRPVAGQQPYTIDVHTDPAVVAFTA